MLDFCVIGSGISGSTIANLLSKKYSVKVFDKARGPGGRSSNKRFKDNLSFDHGVQYVSPKSKEFTKYIQKLHKKKILKTWDENHLNFTFEKKPFSSKYIGKKANNDLAKYNQKGIKRLIKSNKEAIQAVVGKSEKPTAQQAAWTMVVRALLSLDATVTKN